MKNPEYKKMLVFFGFVVLAIAAYFLMANIGWVLEKLNALLGIFKPLIIGFCVAFFAYPPAKKLRGFFEKAKNKWLRRFAKGLGILIVYVVLIAILALLFWVVLPMFYENLAVFAKQVPQFFTSIVNWLNGVFQMFDATKGIDLWASMQSEGFMSFLQKFSVGSLNSLIPMVGGVASSVFSVFIGLIISVYMLLEREALGKVVREILQILLKKRRFEVLQKYALNASSLLYSYIMSLVLDSAVIGTLYAILLSLFHVPYAPFFGVLVFTFNLIPYFGPIIVVVIISLIAIISIGFVNAIWLLLCMIVMGQLDGNFIQPKIVSKSVGISPFWVIFSVIVFGGIFGIPGMLLGVPFTAALRMIYHDYLDDHKINASKG